MEMHQIKVGPLWGFTIIAVFYPLDFGFLISTAEKYEKGVKDALHVHSQSKG